MMKETGSQPFNHQRALRHRPRVASHRAFSTNKRQSQAEAALQAAEEPDIEGKDLPRKDYEDLVDTYGPANVAKDEVTKLEHYRLAPRLALTPEQESHPPHTKRQILEPIDEKHGLKLRRFKRLIRSSRPGFATENKWQAYMDLPSPRLRYLKDIYVWRLFRNLAWVEQRGLENSQRYFTLLEEALSERVPIGIAEWNTAVAFAGRLAHDTTSEEVKNAIETWLRMEREGGVSADNVTFNILFDVAVKARRFALADTIYAEIDRRKLELNRYFRTSKIYYAGIRGDADNVRAAFRELVAAGEIVDTAIMNCVILSLARCGETASAEHVMGKMKLLHEQKFGVAALIDWREKKAMGQQLHLSARQLREERRKHLQSFFGSPYVDDDKKEEIQRRAPIAPDGMTYRILIREHANISGNLDKIRTYIGEIEAAGYRVHHTVFFHLFNGFMKHGGYAFTAWNRKSLEGYWREYTATIAGDAAAAEIAARVKARMKEPATVERYEVYPLDPSDAETSYNESSANPEENNADGDDEEDLDAPPSHLSPTEFRPGPIMAALAAFYKCAGLKRMLEVWEEVQELWDDMGEGDRRRIEDVVAEKRREAGVYVE